MTNTQIQSQPDATTVAILRAVNLAGVEEPPVVAPRGEIGGCVACGHTVVSHFGPDGRWVGCLKGEDDTVFILVPAKREETKRLRAVNGSKPASHVAHERTAEVSTVTTHTPGAAIPRFVYTSTLHHRAKVDKLHLSPTREKVLRTIHESAKTGVLARDIIERAGLPHGSVQQTLNWLRAHRLVKAKKFRPTSS